MLAVARHSETEEELVVYRQEYGDHSLWVRPKQMFLETVEVDGRQVPRFRRLDVEGDQAAGNLLADLPARMPDELSQTILSQPGIRIERIISRGHASPPGFWYDQPQREFVALLAGAAWCVSRGRNGQGNATGRFSRHPGPSSAPSGLDRSGPARGLAGDSLPGLNISEITQERAFACPTNH